MTIMAEFDRNAIMYVVILVSYAVVAYTLYWQVQQQQQFVEKFCVCTTCGVDNVKTLWCGAAEQAAFFRVPGNSAILCALNGTFEH